jgi:hypothetical protein
VRSLSRVSTDDDAPDPADDRQGTGGVGAIVGRLVGRAEATDGTDPVAAAERKRLDRKDLTDLTRALTSSARAAGRASVLGGAWLADLLVDTAPRIPVRNLATLQRHHPGLGPEDLAETLISGAAKASGAVGAAGGALAAVEFAAPPFLLTAPVQLAAETLLVAAVEVKLIAELHEVYGAAVQGSVPAKMHVYVMAWTERRGIDPLQPALRLSVGSAAKRSVRNRLIRRLGRNLTTMGPLLSGAVAGSMVNHRETRRIGGTVRADLRRDDYPPS